MGHKILSEFYPSLPGVTGHRHGRHARISLFQGPEKSLSQITCSCPLRDTPGGEPGDEREVMCSVDPPGAV